MNNPDINAVRAYLLALQNSICLGIGGLDNQADFIIDEWQRENGGGGGISRVLSQGAVFEQAGINFSHVHGDELPASATAHRPELAGRSFQAMGVSLVIHPNNPHIPLRMPIFVFLSPAKKALTRSGGLAVVLI